MSLLRHVCQAGWRVLILSLMCCDPGWIQFLHFPTHSIKGHTPGLPTNEGNAQRVWSLHVTQPDTPKAHEDSGLSSSGPVHWDLAPCHLNLKASQNRKFSCLLPQMRLQDKLHAGYWASSSLSGIFQPQSHLDASWRLKPADPTSATFLEVHIPSRATSGQRRPQVYTQETFAQGPAGNR